MNDLFPLIIEKRNVVTDLRYKSYLLMDLCEGVSETEALAGFPLWYEQLALRARVENFPQLQVRFPFHWQSFGNKLEQSGFNPGLYVVERRLDQSFELPDGIHVIDDVMRIKSQLKRQQSIHFRLNPHFFQDHGLFGVDEYLGDLGRVIEAGNGAFYGICDRSGVADGARGRATGPRGRIIGFIGLESDESGTYINELFVEEKFRGAGLGKRLMQAGFHYVAEAANGGTRSACAGPVNNRIWTTLAAQNEGASRFYSGQGFRETARVDFRNFA
ncbi:GNAT family N-acetyltransferase [Patescibacteria group bacterium]|nr:GNAT family N-acetyltransferase [Patescibacteria group bacterium]